MKNFTMINNSVLDDSNLKYDEKMMFIGILRYFNTSYGYSYPSYDNLMVIMGTKRRETIKKVLDRLVGKGYIRIEKSGRSNRYFILKTYDDVVVEEVVEDPIIEDEFIEDTPVNSIVTEKEIEEEVQSDNYKVAKDSKGKFNIYDYGIGSNLEYNDDDKIKLVKTKIKKLSSEQEREIVKYSHAKIKSVLESAEKVNYNYLINGLNRSSLNAKSFNNFEGRDYNWDVLESQVCGWHSDNESGFNISAELQKLCV